MENFVLGIFQEQLAKFIVGFRKEQVNANLLNGKGEIRDVSLNCDFLNEALAKVTPFIELESVHVSKLSFHVTAWSNLKKAPIVVVIEDIKATIVEPLSCLDKTKRRVPQQLTREELHILIQQGLYKLRRDYNLFDRIVDNLHIEIRSLSISFQPRGKFKTKRVGAWTPPLVLVELKHVKYVSVDEFGNEASPEQVWHHNRHAHHEPMATRSYMIYKKVSMQCSLELQPHFSQKQDALPPLIKDAHVQVHMAYRIRLRDAAIMAVQLDATLQKMEIHVNQKMVPVLAHAMAGMQYCLAKDRSFEDPLVTETVVGDETMNVVEESHEVSAEEHVNGVVEEDLEPEDDEDMEEDVITAEVSESLSESSSEETSSVEGGEQKAEPPAKQTSSLSMRDRPAYLRRPVFMLPNGIVIHDRFSLSLSVHQCTVRGIYSTKEEGYVQLVLKGLVSEVMWPKANDEKGGYAQASLSYMSLQEKYGPRVRSILLGGIQHDIHQLPIWIPGKPRPEKPADESFPLFEDRSIRPDPFGLRHTFPAQAIGLKMTVNYIEKVSNPDEEEIMVHHEIGMDQFDFLLDSDAWCRVVRFAMNEDGNGFDPRWHSGDWVEDLTTDMLVDPTQALNLSDHLQPTKEIFLDENSMISSDLMNVTARIRDMEIRVPAAICEDVRSCDIVVGISETMVVVSSALPRTFLTGKIGASIHGDGPKTNDQIDFPNDPSDICYSLERSEDPSIRQQGTMTARVVSTARSQLTVRGFSVRIVPVIPFCDAKPPQQFLEPLEMTMIVCFEGEPPVSPESNLIKTVFFVSIQIHRLCINCDVDVIAGACSTLLRHADVVRDTIDVVESLRKPITQRENPTLDVPVSRSIGQDGISKMKKNLKNRRVLVRRQIARSRETGGLSVSICVQMAEYSFTFWRQNVPLTSRFRASLIDDADVQVDDRLVALMKVFHIEMKGLEMGVEWSVQTSNRRVVVKGCLTDLKMEMCDLEGERLKRTKEEQDSGKGTADEETELKTAPAHGHSDDHSLIELVTFGAHAHTHRSYAEVAGGHNDVLLRAEECLNFFRSVSFACEVGPPGVVYLRVPEIETLILLFIEALLMPTGIQPNRLRSKGQCRKRINFPDRSVGALFSWLIHGRRDGGVFRNEDETSSVLTESEEKEEVDTFVHALVQRLLPENIHTVVARLTVVDVLLFVPEKRPDTEKIDESRWLGLVVHQSTLLAGFFPKRRPQQESEHYIMGMLAAEGKTWSSFFDASETGIHLLVRARPSLYAAERKDSMCVTTDTLVSEFEVACSYRPSDVAVSMGDTTLSVKNLNDLNHLYCSLLAVEDQRRIAFGKIDAVVSGLSYEPKLKSVGADERDASRSPGPPRAGCTFEEEEDGHVTIVRLAFESSSEAEHSLRGLRKSICILREASEAHSMQLRELLDQQQRNVNILRHEAFSKERERVAALALVSSQVTGWLRMGGTHVFGQRASGVTTMWRYYAVLHRSLLILYSSAGEAKPFDVIVLDGARLFPLAGGRRKRDVQRGFSIIESGGVVRFFLAESGPEYDLWIRELHKTIRRGTWNEADEEKTDHSSLSGPSHEHQLQNAGDAGATTGYDAFELGPEGTPTRRVQLRERLSAVTSTTKSKLGSATAGTRSRLGSAVQAARQRSASNTEDQFTQAYQAYDDMDRGQKSHRTIATETLSESSAARQEPTFGTREAEPLGTDDGAPRAGGRFASIRAGTKNRLGSALQAAKEKGKAAADAQRRRRLQQQSDAPSTPGLVPVSSDFQAAHTVLTAHPTQMQSGARQLAQVAIGPSPTARPGETQERGDAPRSRQEFQGEISFDESHGEGGDEAFSVEPSLSGDGNEIQQEGLHPDTAGLPGRRSQLRDKFGAAVSSVRRTTAPEGSSDNASAGRMRRLGSSARSDADTGSSHAIKLRGIRVGSGNPANDLHDTNGSDIDVQLRKIKRCWVAGVEVCEKVADLSPNLETQGSAEVSDVEPSLPEGSNHSDRLETPSSVEELKPVPELDISMHEEEDASKQDDRASSSDDNEVVTKATQPQPSPSPERRNLPMEREFRIHVVPDKSVSETETAEDIQGTKIVRTASDLLALYTTISTCVSCIEALASDVTLTPETVEGGVSHRSLMAQGDMTAFESVRLAGRLLDGLFEFDATDFDETKPFNDYQCEIIKEFLNLTLECPLPENAVEALSRFLERPDIIVWSSEYASPLFSTEPTSPDLDVAGPSISPSLASTQQILAHTIACENELVRVETQHRYAMRLLESCQTESANISRTTTKEAPVVSMPLIKPKPFLEPFLPSKITEELHQAMHGALMNVMTERDESHAQLIAASVLHMHGMEQERKKAERLSEQLTATAALLKASQNAAAPRFFAPPDTQTPRAQERDKMQGKVTELQEQMIQNSEQEMLVLCQQLAGEISAKTAAKLEVIRLKESRKIEKENEQSEKDALMDELRRCKELLATEERKSSEARQEALAWKKAYEELTPKNGGKKSDTSNTL